MTSNDARILNAIAPFGGSSADLPFWRACAEGEFLLHHCASCDRYFWPASRCTEHGDLAMAWAKAQGQGILYTYTVQHHAYTPAMRGRVPYAIGVVKLREGPFFHSRILECPIEAIAVGIHLKIRFEPDESGLVLPVLEPA